jgi:hypothetical protein
MAYNVIVTASVSVNTSLNNIKSSLKLPEAAFGTRQNPVYPYNVATKISAGSFEDFNLAAQNFGAPKLLVVKSTRPVRVTYTAGTTTFTSLLSTFVMQVMDTTETGLDLITNVRVQVPSAPVVQPVGALPEGYPAALVEVFVVAGDS